MTRWLAPVITLTLIVAACGGSQEESGFEANLGPIDAELRPALADGVDAENVPEVQRNFLELCARGGEESLPDLPTVQADGLVLVCGCTYNALVDSLVQAELDELGTSPSADDLEAIDRLAFDRITELDDDILAGGALSEEVDALVRSCVRSEAGL